MKKLILILLLALLPLATALEFYPPNLEINVKPNEQTCRTVFFTLDDPATITNEWATDPSIKWSVTYFDKTAEYHSIQITHPSEVSTDDTQAEFCISGSRPGEYRGALVFRQAKVGNSVVQFAIWLKVKIESDSAPSPQNNSDIPSNDDDEDDDDNDSDDDTGEISDQVSNNPPPAQPLAYNPPQQPEEITIQNPPIVENNRNTLVLLSASTTVLVAIFLIVLMLAKRPKKYED